MKINKPSSRTCAVTALVTVSLLILVALITAYSLFAPHFYPEEEAYVYIDRNDTRDSVQTKVKEVGHASDTWTLGMLMYLKNYQVHSGRYLIAPGESNYTVFRRLAGGLQTPLMLKVGNPRTVSVLARSIGSQLEFDSSELLERLTDPVFCALLGYTPQTIPALFIPNSYEIYWDISLEEFLRRMQKEYDHFWNKERLEKARAMGYTPLEVSTLASIVDSETNYAPEKPTVAGLYINRLRQGMKLQADPTVIFGVGDFSIRRVGKKHLAVDSPYNTYRYTGLPPGPIRIPSISGIDAVLNYEHHKAIYMCAKEDFSGSHNFAVTWAEHKANATRYQKALTARSIVVQ